MLLYFLPLPLVPLPVILLAWLTPGPTPHQQSRHHTSQEIVTCCVVINLHSTLQNTEFVFFIFRMFQCNAIIVAEMINSMKNLS
jgi:hypothetical protein